MRLPSLNLAAALLLSSTSALLPSALPFLPFSAPALAQATDSRKAEADQWLDLGIHQYRTNQYEAARQSWEQALQIYRSLQDRPGEAASMAGLGILYFDLGDYRQSIDFSQQALLLIQKEGDRQAEADTLARLGNAYFLLGDYPRSIGLYQQSATLFRKIGDQGKERDVLKHLLNAYGSLGDYRRAMDVGQQCGKIPVPYFLPYKKPGDAAAPVPPTPPFSSLREVSTLQSLDIPQFPNNEPQIPSPELRSPNLPPIKPSYSLLSVPLLLYDRSSFARIPYPRTTPLPPLPLPPYLIPPSAGQGQLVTVRTDFEWGKSHYNLGRLEYLAQDYTKASQMFNRALVYYQTVKDRDSAENQDKERLTLAELARTYRALNQDNLAIPVLEQALLLNRVQQNQDGVRYTLEMIAQIYQEMGQSEPSPAKADQWLHQGTQQYNTAQYSAAISSWQHALSRYRQLGNQSRASLTLFRLGQAHYWRTRVARSVFDGSESRQPYALAIEYFQQALALDRALQDPAGAADSLYQLGMIDYETGAYTQAAQLLNQALAGYQSLHNRHGETLTLSQLGSIYGQLKQYNLQLRVLEQSLAIDRLQQNRFNESSTLRIIAQVYEQMGQPKKAEAARKQAYAVSGLPSQAQPAQPQATDPYQAEADRFFEQGNEQYKAKQYEAAIQTWQQALSQYRQLGNYQRESSTLYGLGQAHYRLGQYDPAIGYFQQSLVHDRNLGDRSGQADIQFALGRLYRLTQNHDQAIRLLNQALTYYQGDLKTQGEENQPQRLRPPLFLGCGVLIVNPARYNPIGTSNALFELGQAYRALKQYGLALPMLEQSLAIDQEQNNPENQRIVLETIAQIYDEMGKPDKAAAARQQAAAIAPSPGK